MAMLAACPGTGDVGMAGTSSDGTTEAGTSGPAPDGSGSTTTGTSTSAGSGDDADDSTGEPPEPGPLWHVESPADSARTWLVSPTGERVYWLGVNTVMRDKECDGILDYIRRDEPTVTANVEWARLSTHMPFVLGASWHAWSDRYLAADELHQINMGLMRCEVPAYGHLAGERWQELDDRVAETNCAIMDRIAMNTGL